MHEEVEHHDGWLILASAAAFALTAVVAWFVPDQPSTFFGIAGFVLAAFYLATWCIGNRTLSRCVAAPTRVIWAFLMMLG